MCRPSRRQLRGRLIRLGEMSEDDAQSLHRGTGGSTHMKESARNTGSPTAWSGQRRPDQPDAREGQAGRSGVAERFVVPRKPGNSGGGKGPQFKTDAGRSEGHGDWATYQLRMMFRSRRWRRTRRRREVLSESRLREICTSGCVSSEGWHVQQEKGLPGQKSEPRSLDSRVAGNQDSEAYRQRLPWGGDESPGRNNSERKSGLENE